MRRLSLVGLALALMAASAAAQEWSRFRGPNGMGESEASTIPASWTERTQNWMVTLPGKGHSSPVLWGQKIFLLSADPVTAERYVLCINAADGKEIWRRTYPGVKHHLHANSSFASSTPACDANQIYVAWSDPEFTRLMALDHAGNEKWTVNLGPWVSQHGFGSSPMIYGDLVVVNCSQEDSNGTDPRLPKESFIVAVEQIRAKSAGAGSGRSFPRHTRSPAFARTRPARTSCSAARRARAFLPSIPRRATRTGRCRSLRCGRSARRCRWAA